jgi:hypothetical protein
LNFIASESDGSIHPTDEKAPQLGKSVQRRLS